MFAVSGGAVAVIIVAAVLAVLAVGWFLTTRKTPQDQPGKVVADRPAGPDAESMRPDERGTLRTGPRPANTEDRPYDP